MQIRLLTTLNTAKIQQAYYTELSLHILKDANVLSKKTISAEQAQSAETDEERCAILNKMSEDYARLEAPKQALLAIQKLSEKANRKYKDAKATYNRFCQRHGLKEIL